MDYSITLKFSLLGILFSLSSCNFFTKKNIDISSFYTDTHFGQFPILPLVQPIKLHYHKLNDDWGIDFSTSNITRVNIVKQDSIGIQNNYIYGIIPKYKFEPISYNKNTRSFLHKFGSIIDIEDKELFPTKDEIEILPIEITKESCIYEIPQRWYVIDISNKSIEVFFTKKEYLSYLRLKNISGRMYNSKDYQEQFYKTGLLPWFPNEIRKKILAKK